MSPWTSIVVLYYKDAYDVISVTMATPQVHKIAIVNPSAFSVKSILAKSENGDRPNLHFRKCFEHSSPKLFTWVLNEHAMKKFYRSRPTSNILFKKRASPCHQSRQKELD